ncbi:phage terminase small subunit P27 family [Martelella radicis]|uniref:P27 family predicted phage terminase small subunit n=1 Tax=Martelella radicis TaxID=1397476 RepID=A0A7W6KLI9_9HYPH|nr:phage terminase small subunit P27 family [Martelella radicis]MBB4123285.1 P27 family predicted phage terminase small subunit [Martelella radicis]
MSTRGRKADPRELEDALTEAPPMPDSMPDSMRDEWDAVTTELVKRQILSKAMLGAVETYILARWMQGEAKKAIAEHGALIATKEGFLKQNPACTVLGRAQQQITRLSAELGLTPASRARAGMGPEEDGDEQFGLFTF